jgi:diguanylate cyclase (GGDEF)-like protein/PAS domain S-box-containing protein
MLRDGEIDVMLNIVSTQERRKYLDYTTPYLEAEAGIYSHKDIQDIHSLNDLAGMRVAVPKGFFVEELLKRHYPDIKLVLLEDSQKCLEAVAFGQADATVGELGVLNHLLEKAFITNVKLARQVQDRRFTSTMGMAVNKNQSILRDILQKGIDVISPEEIQALQHKWNLISSEEREGYAQLSEEEQRYLATLGEIRMCVDPDWMPLEKIDQNGRHIGIGAEVMNLMRDKLPVPVRLVRTSSWQETLAFARERHCDIISMAMRTTERETYLNFSEPYLQLPLVIATTDDKRFITGASDLNGRAIGIVKDYAVTELLRERHSEIRLVEVESVSDGINKVNSGALFGFVDALAPIAYAIEEQDLLDIKVAGRLDEQWQLGIGVRSDWPQLLTITNKVLAQLDKQRIQDIYHHWVAVQMVEEFDYRVLIKYLAAVALLFLFLAYRHRQVRVFARAQEQLNQQLVDANQIITEKEEVSRSLLESTEEGIFGIDTSGITTFVNPAAAKILDFEQEELLGQSMHRLVHHSYVDGSPYPQDECPMMRAIFERAPQRVDDEYFWRKDGGCLPVTYSSTPILRGEEVVGAVIAFNDITELKRAEEELRHLSVTDQLTGIYNRKRLDEVLAQEAQRAERYQHVYSVIMADIDKFKEVNDQYGHQVGDEVLKKMVAILQDRVRVSDTLGRWGGEEFMVLCPGTALDRAMQLAEQLRIEVESSEFPEVGQKTASFGVASYRQGDKADDVVKRADDALYAAKEGGRNRVVAEEKEV